MRTQLPFVDLNQGNGDIMTSRRESLVAGANDVHHTHHTLCPIAVADENDVVHAQIVHDIVVARTDKDSLNRSGRSGGIVEAVVADEARRRTTLDLNILKHGVHLDI